MSLSKVSYNSVTNAGIPKQYFTWVTKLILRTLVWILTALYNISSEEMKYKNN